MSKSADVIAARDAEWGALIDAHDLDGVVGIYDEEGSFLIPGQPPLEGHAGVRAAWEHLFGLPEFKLRLGSPSVTVASGDDMAMDRGTYELSFRGEDGPFLEKGKYLVVWRKNSQGEWKVLSDMFNNNG